MTMRLRVLFDKDDRHQKAAIILCEQLFELRAVA